MTASITEEAIVATKPTDIDECVDENTTEDNIIT